MSRGLKNVLSLLLSYALVVSMVPAAALAEGIDELSQGLPVVGAPASGDEAVVLGAGEQTADGEDSGGDGRQPSLLASQGEERLEAQTADDPFYLVDHETGQRVTTLHTTGTYQMVNADGSPYLDDIWSVYFLPVGNDPRGHDFAYDTWAKELDVDADGTVEGHVLEDFVDRPFIGHDWQLPTGTYRLSLDAEQENLTSQQYKVINDGLFSSSFEPGDLGHGNSLAFSAKPFTEGKTDEEYDGLYYDEEGGYYYEGEKVDEQEPFVPASDTRIKISVDTAVDLDDTSAPQLESIALWKSDKTLAELEEEFAEVSSDEISRAFGKNPSWPTYLNFAKDYDEQAAVLWERSAGGGALETRFVPTGDAAGAFIIDHARFADAALDGDGLYFPVVKMSYRGESYTFAYYPIEVSAEGAAERTDPRITTTSLANAQLGEAYAATLTGRAGAKPAGSLSWSVSEGSLPAGLVLDAATGTISGTPTEAGTKSFAITLTETVDGVSRSATRGFSLKVLDDYGPEEAASRLALGEVDYGPGTIWANGDYMKPTYFDMRIPISHDVRAYGLGQTELWYLLELETGEVGDTRLYVFHERAADILSDDGSMLQVHAVVQQGNRGIWQTKALKSVHAFLVPKTDAGDYAFEPGAVTGAGTLSDGTVVEAEPVERTLAFRYGGSDNRRDYLFIDDNGYSTYPVEPEAAYRNLPEMAHADLAAPDVRFGSWISIPRLSFAGNSEDWAAKEGRVRLWSYDGETTVGEPQEEYLSEDAHFKLAPGAYAFTVEGLVRTYDENGVDLGMDTWVDIVGKAEGAHASKGTYPKQYVIEVGPNEGTSASPRSIDVTYSSDNIDDINRHSVSPQFQLADGSYASARDAAVGSSSVRYDTSWYRRVDNADPTKDVLVATGDSVMFGPSAYDLYVEVKPTGRDAGFWKSKKQKVSEKSRAVQVQLERKQRFEGTFTLSCVSGKTPEAGAPWGIVEVRTPSESGGFSTYNLWPTEPTLRVPNLTSGAIVTYTPTVNLKGGQVSYTVPEEATESFAANLEAPIAAGSIDFGNLSFVDARGGTTEFSLDDGATGVKVMRATSVIGGVPSYDYEAPFYLLDGHSIVLTPEEYVNELPFVHEPARYRVTITHKDKDAPERFGGMAPDGSCSRSFDIELSPDATTASIADATLTSRGYALVPMEGAQRQLTSLALFRTTVDASGEVTDATLVEKAPAGTLGSADQLRTPFVDAGTYTLYSVYVDAMGRGVPYDSFSGLEGLVSSGRGARIDFEVADGRVTNLGADQQSGTFWSWTNAVASDKGMVDKSESVVRAELAYRDKVSIQMHAELAKGVKLSDNARLEVVTNQASDDSREGYMHPQALTINGKSLVLNRWENLFAQTQNMESGNLDILLAEAKKQGSECASFPMDMTLIVPLNSSVGAVDASIWLVDGDRRALVGSCHELVNETDLVVPEYVAWRDFSVYGNTAPRAHVALFVDGMQAATTRADDYGYYTASISLPEDVRNYDTFSLTATTQWSDADGVTHTATTEARDVIYTQTVPVVERITMCYQSQPGEKYRSIVSYDRGTMPDKYLRLYRSENEKGKTSEEHAKDFWIVEFANGGAVCNVEVTVPRDSGDIVMETTDRLAIASGWIPDIKRMGEDYSYAGELVRDALGADGTHGFVSKPTYFATAPSEISVHYDLDLDAVKKRGFEPVENLGAVDGAFQGFKASGVTQTVAKDYLDKMAESGYVYFLSDGDANRLRSKLVSGDTASVTDDDITSTDAMATSMRARMAGYADDWMLLGLGADHVEAAYDGVSNPAMLLLHHKASSTSYTQQQAEDEIQSLLEGTSAQREAFERWCEKGSVDHTEQVTYKGNELYLAADGEMKGVDDPSCLYVIATKDAAGNVQWESLQKYTIKGADGFYYTYQRADKEQLTSITWDEANGRRNELVYTVASEQVNSGVTALDDLLKQWAMTLGTIHRGLDFALGYEGEEQGESDLHAAMDGLPLGGQFDGQESNRLYAAGFWDSVVGFFKGDAQKFAGERALNEAGLKSTNQILKESGDFKRQFEDPNKAAEIASQDGSFFRYYMGLVGAGGLIGVNMTANAAYDTATAPKNAIGVATTIANVSPAQSLYEKIAKGDCFGWNGSKSKNAKPSKPKRKKPQTDEEWKQEYWRQAIARLMGWDYDMTIFYGQPRDRIKKCEEYFENNLKMQNPVLWKKYMLHKRANDPSGIVYEGVLSNPVKGATVQLYTFNPAASSVGMDPAQFIDSTQFGVEENPQVTGEDGRYQWFVPEGYWQVRVSKKGYEDASTGSSDSYGLDATKTITYTDASGQQQTVEAATYWMPVLPVQLDVNIPLVSKEPPEVESVEGDVDGMTVTFSKYMKVDTLKAELFAIDGAAPASIKAVSAEPAGDGSGEMLARSFRLSYPKGTRLATGDNAVSVSFSDAQGVAVSYAGVAASAEGREFQTTCTVHVDAPFFIDADPIDEGNHGAEVDWMGRKGISTGWEVTGGREYRGMRDVTRCDFAAFLYRLYDLSDDGERNDSNALSEERVTEVLRDVSDCDGRTSHAAEVAWMVDSGISKGWTDKGKNTVSFRPMANVARQDMAAFLYRFADIQDGGGQDKSLGMGPEKIVFSDVVHGDEGNHASEVEWLASIGVTKGWDMKDGTFEFRGRKTVARQDMAAFMKRLYDYLP